MKQKNIRNLTSNTHMYPSTGWKWRRGWCGFLLWGWLCLPVRWQFTCHGIGQLPEIYTKELISHERRKTLVVRSEETHKSPRVHKLPNKCIEINYQEKVNIIACIRTHRLGFFSSRRDIFLKKSDFYHWIYTTMEIHDTFLQKLTPSPAKEKVADTALKMSAN